MRDRDKSWFDKMIEMGHIPRMYDGNLDVFVVDYDIHNGPGCSACNWSICMHCRSIDEIPECTNKERIACG